MNSVVNLRAYTDPSHVPTLVLIDLQQEYLSPARALAVSDSKTALANCSAALAIPTARSRVPNRLTYTS